MVPEQVSPAMQSLLVLHAVLHVAPPQVYCPQLVVEPVEQEPSVHALAVVCELPVGPSVQDAAGQAVGDPHVPSGPQVTTSAPEHWDAPGAHE